MKIRGTRITIGGTEYLMPPANFATLDAHDEFLKRYIDAGKAGPAQVKRSDFSDMAEIVLGALKRNYPELTADVLALHLDLGNIGELFQAALKSSGFEEPKPGE